MKIFRRRPFVFIVLAIAVGCSDSSVPTEPALIHYTLEAVSPTLIVGVVDVEVIETPRIRVIDERGRPVSGVLVGFQTEDGTVGSAHSFTNGNGVASAGRWKLGTESRQQFLSANVAGLEPLVFTANAASGPAAKISNGGDEQASRPGSAVPDPLSVHLADKFNNPVSGQSVTFTIVSGAGSLEHATSVTGPDGTASPGTWTLGPSRGPQHVKARYVAPANSNHWEIFFTAYACDNPGTSGCAQLPPACSTSTECGEIVFVSSRDGQAEIYSVNRDGSALTRLTNNPAGDWDPAWSPDGKRIAFVSDRSSAPEIYVMNADGSNVVRRTFWANASASPAWSPDGKQIVFAAGSAMGTTLWIMDADAGGAGPDPFFPEGKDPVGMESLPYWSADLNVVAFAHTLFNEDCNIGTANIDGSGFKLLTTGGPCISLPSWSRTTSRMSVAVAGSAGVWLCVLDPERSGLQLLAPTGLFSKSSWSPDDAFTAFASGTASERKLMWIKSDGSESGTIVVNGWSPDWRPR
jgi:TolB protein